MSATNATTNYQLPLFIGTDKPAWLTDWNGAMNAIDTAVANVNTAQSGTASSLSTLSLTVEGLSTTVGNHTTSIGTMETAISGNTGSINTINSLIGNGEPTTTDKTLIGAINEINAQVGSVDADDVSYDNTTSGLTATDVQAAIDELAQGGSVDADDVSYDNQTSGLTATNVQDAIDEIASSGALTLKASSTGATLGAAAASLKTAYDALSTTEKMSAIIYNKLINVVYRCALIDGIFSSTLHNLVTPGAVSTVSLNVVNGAAYTDANDTSSAVVSVGDLELYA